MMKLKYANGFTLWSVPSQIAQLVLENPWPEYERKLHTWSKWASINPFLITGNSPKYKEPRDVWRVGAIGEFGMIQEKALPQGAYCPLCAELVVLQIRERYHYSKGQEYYNECPECDLEFDLAGEYDPQGPGNDGPQR